MISVSEEAEKKLQSLLRGKPLTNLKIVYGPDQRLRLLDEGPKKYRDEKTYSEPDILILDVTSPVPDKTEMDVHRQDLIFNRPCLQK